MEDSAVRPQEKKFKRLVKRIIANWQIYLLLTPLMIWLWFFAYRPMYGVIMAFQNFSPFLGFANSQWVGFANFENLLFGPGSSMFWRAFWNTVTISFYNLIFGFPAPIIIAIMFHELKDSKFKNAAQSVLLLPNFLSEIIISGLVIALLQPNSGAINQLLVGLGIVNEGIFFLTRPEWFRSIYITVGIWSGAGFGSLVYFSALLNTSKDLYEAAEIDGATRVQRILHISIPSIMPTIAVMFIMAVGGILSVGFERVLLLQQPITYSTSDVLATYVYRLGLGQNNFSIGAAAGLFNSVISMILVFIANRVSKRLTERSLW